MATIAENLQIIKDSTDAIRQVILDKGGSLAGGISTYTDSITTVINNASNNNNNNSNTSTHKKDVNFYDYDGTLLHSYAKDEFLSLSQLPELPTREGLTCQEWNYNLSKAKEYVGEYGKLDIGATYITDDGKTRLYISIATDGRMDVPLCFSQTVSNGVTIDWGDGNATQTISDVGDVYTTHTYNEIGDYIITLNPISGCILGLGHNDGSYCVMDFMEGVGNNFAYSNMLQNVEIGNGVKSIGEPAFYGCYSLSSIVIPIGVTSIGNDAFNCCHSLSSIIIPNSVTSIGNYVFHACCSLSSIVIPNSVTSIGNAAFCYCYSLTSIIIPNGVTRISYNIFCECYSLLSIVIPNSVKSIYEYAFSYCRSLSSIVIPNSVTSIGEFAFYECQSLSSIIIPNSVTYINDYAFDFCDGMAYYDFSQHTSIPILAGTDAFSSRIPSDCKIIVPDSLYYSWKSATNWSYYSGYIIKKSDWDNGVLTQGGISGGDGS